MPSLLDLMQNRAKTPRLPVLAFPFGNHVSMQYLELSFTILARRCAGRPGDCYAQLIFNATILGDPEMLHCTVH